MKAHRTDLVSLVFGLLFVGLTAWWLSGRLLGLALPPVGWFLAGGLIMVGVLGLVGALRAGRDDRRVDPAAPGPKGAHREATEPAAEPPRRAEPAVEAPTEPFSWAEVPTEPFSRAEPSPEPLPRTEPAAEPPTEPLPGVEPGEPTDRPGRTDG